MGVKGRCQLSKQRDCEYESLLHPHIENIINWKNIETAYLNLSMSTSQKAADV